jgi:SAM-dependent methyltransferase
MDSIGVRLRRALRAFRDSHEHARDRGVDRADNVAYNRDLWDRYAERWRDPAFRATRADAPDEIPFLERIGDEWGRRRDVDAIVDGFILPWVGPDSVVGEIGCGGGRVAERVVPHVECFYGFDISARMLERARVVITDPRARFVLLDDARLPSDLSGSLDFIYAFDVFLHMDLYVMRRYFEEMARVLKVGGNAFVHTTNLTSDVGWSNFVKFDRYRPETHFYVSPETVRTLADRAGFRLVKESEPDQTNFYLARDYLVVLKKH